MAHTNVIRKENHPGLWGVHTCGPFDLADDEAIIVNPDQSASSSAHDRAMSEAFDPRYQLSSGVADQIFDLQWLHDKDVYIDNIFLRWETRPTADIEMWMIWVDNGQTIEAAIENGQWILRIDALEESSSAADLLPRAGDLSATKIAEFTPFTEDNFEGFSRRNQSNKIPRGGRVVLYCTAEATGLVGLQIGWRWHEVSVGL